MQKSRGILILGMKNTQKAEKQRNSCTEDEKTFTRKRKRILLQMMKESSCGGKA
jgi:hypothetical protein